MNHETPDVPSPEEQAEQILKDALVGADVDGRDCPQGDACAIHFRNDEEILDNEIEFGRIITYVGDYMVTTTDNQELDNPATFIKLALGLVKPDEIKKYETTIIKVGDGPLANLRVLSYDEQSEAIRFIQLHDSWANFKGAHEAVVESLKLGLIDVSRSAIPKGK